MDQEAFLKAALDQFEHLKPCNVNNLAIPGQSLAPCKEKPDNRDKSSGPAKGAWTRKCLLEATALGCCVTPSSRGSKVSKSSSVEGVC